MKKYTAPKTISTQKRSDPFPWFRLARGWRFTPEALTPAAPRGHRQTYLSTKAGQCRGPARPFYPDHTWQRVQIPHDWVREKPFSPAANMSQGYKERGQGWYRLNFSLPGAASVPKEEDLPLGAVPPGQSDAEESRIEIIFEGIAGVAEFFVNGYRMGRQESSYLPTILDISDVVHRGGGTNLLAVKVDARQPDGWWYEGAGIYRPVYLRVSPPVRMDWHTLWARPRPADPPDRETAWEIPGSVSLTNSSSRIFEGILQVELSDPTGRKTAAIELPLRMEPSSGVEKWWHMKMERPELWSPETPRLYELTARLLSGEEILDEQKAPAGFRTLAFHAEEGFFLNGRPYKLKGTCNHQDHAGVGAALPREVIRWRIQRLKELGSNAYRSAHNPASPELLQECDRQGLLVIDEARHFGSDPQTLAQWEEMIRRHRRHPSLFMWSIFNEEPIQGKPEAARFVRAMKRAAARLDPSRLVTAGMNGGFMESAGAAPALDVAGLNYHIGYYDAFHQRYPEQPVMGSETASTLSTRGIFNDQETSGMPAAPSGAPSPTLPCSQQVHLTDMDNHKPFWGATAEEAWAAIRDRSFLGGTFVWTGFDYRGEPTPFEWPAISSQFGIYDTCGFDKAQSWLYRALWQEPEEKLICHILPWELMSDEETFPLRIYTNAPRLTYRLDGGSPPDDGSPPDGGSPQGTESGEWQSLTLPASRKVLLPCAPQRKVEVRLYRGETLLGEVSRIQPGSPAALELIPHKPAPAAAEERFPADAWIITCRAVDAQGRWCPDAAHLITFRFPEDVLFLGGGNGDPGCHDGDFQHQRHLFGGLCQIILQRHSKEKSKGEEKSRPNPSAVIHAEAAGLQPGQLSLPPCGAPHAPDEPSAPREPREPREPRVKTQPGAPDYFSTPGDTPPLLSGSSPRIPLEEWWQSPLFESLPDPALEVSDQDMNSWFPVTLGGSHTLPRRETVTTEQGWRLFRTVLDLPSGAPSFTATLHLDTGGYPLEVFAGKTPLPRGEDLARLPLTIDPTEELLVLTLRVPFQGGRPLPGPLFLELPAQEG